MKIKEMDLLEKKESREEFISRTEVLDKVGDLLLLPNTEYATTEQVAEYYKVDLETVKTVINRHKEELVSDGFDNFNKTNVIDLLKVQKEHLTSVAGKSIVSVNGEKLEIPNRGLRLFPKRAILRVGMLLRDSEVAKEVRTRLLDIIHDTQQSSPEIIHSVVEEISEEKKLMIERVEAEMNGNYDQVSVVNAKLFALKNKRISELEKTNEIITTNSLTIIDSKSVINRIVRRIAMDKYNGLFGKAWGELYSVINYKLNINIKARNKKKTESYLDTLTDKEVFQVEKTVRNWAVELGLDVEKLLKIS